MARPTLHFHLFFLAIIFFSTAISCWAKAPAFFIFGDSTVDPGNNNYIQTIPENQANYPPYGQNGFFDGPTGRFSDGRVIVDFIVINSYNGTSRKKPIFVCRRGGCQLNLNINGLFPPIVVAEYAKLPLIPPFLQQSAEFLNGCNFASGGAGVLTETHEGQAIDLQKQLKNFEEVQSLLTEKLGDVNARELISKAVYFISIGSNDYMGGYLGNPKIREAFPPEEYISMVIGNLTQAIQVLYQKGGRKFGFLSLSPLGCLPALRALNPNAEGGCLEEASALALAHNKALSAVLRNLEHILKGFKYSNSNFYTWLNDRMHHPDKYAFKEGINACCGTGPYGGVFSCGGKKAVSEYKLCDNARDYVWWDSFHPTERIHEQFAQALWSGPPFSVGPYNLEGLFFGDKNLIIADIVDNPDDVASSTLA